MNDHNNEMLRGFLRRLPSGQTIKVAASWTPTQIVKNQDATVTVGGMRRPDLESEDAERSIPYLWLGIGAVALLFVLGR